MTADLPALRQDEFDALPTDRSAVSNPSLRQYLKWNRNRYFLARDGLVDKGLVVRDRDTWEGLEEAQRYARDPENLNDFISTHLFPATRSLISRRLRSAPPSLVRPAEVAGKARSWRSSGPAR